MHVYGLHFALRPYYLTFKNFGYYSKDIPNKRFMFYLNIMEKIKRKKMAS